jgi:hypothetical protein
LVVAVPLGLVEAPEALEEILFLALLLPQVVVVGAMEPPQPMLVCLEALEVVPPLTTMYPDLERKA